MAVAKKPRKTSRKTDDRLDREIAQAFIPYFNVGDIVLMGKYKNKKGVILGFGKDKWGNPTVEIEPIPKGRKQNRIVGLYRIWRADVKEGKRP